MLVYCILHYFRTANKDSQLFDLDKYFKQQAALAEQKRKLKKVSKTPSDTNHLLPVKKAKLLSTDAKTSKKCQKPKHEKNKYNIINTLQSIDKTCSNVTNEITDSSSESEYIPSDNELNSGNINI